MTLKNLWKSIKISKLGRKLSWFSQFYFFLLWCGVRWRKNYDVQIQKVFLCLRVRMDDDRQRVLYFLIALRLH